MGESENPTFGATLRRFRCDAELTQEELAEHAGLSVRAIGDLERGISQAPYQATVLQLAAALQLDATDRATLLAASHRPPPTSLHLPPITPLAPTPLLGRERELREIQELMTEPGCRLVTLLGPGGGGKTRLAVEVALQLQVRFPGAVAVIPLASRRDPRLVLPTIAQALGLREGAGSSIAESLIAYLRDTRLFLVLDNLEHLLPAAPSLAQLVAACPQLRLLATSRAALRVQGEQEYPVEPLATSDPRYAPPAEALLGYPAIALFVQRARAVRPGFKLDESNAATVAAICHRLDGLPLAIELAAPRVVVLPPPALLDRLEQRLPVLIGGAQDLPARQQTMRDTIAWSHDLLDPAEQTLFRRLAAFAGGCTLEAAEAVCQDIGELDIDILDGLTSLVDKSLMLVQPTPDGERPPRFGMLETIREFAQDRLASSGEEEAAYGTHAAYFLALAEEAQPALRGPEQSAWLERLEQEHDNLRGALRTARQEGDVDLGLRLVSLLWPFWLARGHLHVAQGWLDALIAMPETANASPGVRADALYTAGALSSVRGDNDRAVPLLRQALDLARQSGNDRCTAATLHLLRALEGGHGNFHVAEALLDESLTIYRRLGDQPGVCAVLRSRAGLARFQGEFDRATALYQEALTLSRSIGDLRMVADILASFGNMLSEQGRPAAAFPLHEEARELRQRLGDRFGVADILLRSGEAAMTMGDGAAATDFLAEALEVFRALGVTYAIAYVRLHQGENALHMGEVDAAQALTEESLNLFREIDDPRCVAAALARLADVAREQQDYERALGLYRESLRRHRELYTRPEIARCLEQMARLACVQGQPERAACLHGAATALRAAMNAEMAPADRPAYDRDLAAVRKRLGAPAFSAAETAGRALNLEQAMEYALQEDPSPAYGRRRLPAACPPAEGM